MPDYGVPGDLEGTLDWSWAEDRLNESRNFWLATVDPQCRPHVLPVWGVWYEHRFWFSAASSAFKVRNIEQNQHVVVTTDDTVNVVSIEGTARRVDGRRDVAEAWANRYEDDPKKRDELAGFMMSGACFEVTPVKAFGLIETAELFSSSATRWVW
jgi:nitroimidazol reductase NimA-like FMN-containing flavoprotein (pyridoxamine 5'-phosphate oxidase superfamily)